MDEQNLIAMANQIGSFFDSMPDRQEALIGIADHIRRFWEPRMRRALLGTLDTTRKTALYPIVLEALMNHRAELTPSLAYPRGPVPETWARQGGEN